MVDIKEIPSRNVEDIVSSASDNTAYSKHLNESIVCSSYAHTLGVYAIAFGEVNFEGNISFTPVPETKPEVKKPVIEPMKIDPLHFEIPKKNQPVIDPLQESIIQKPGDAPINLDMNAFLGETQVTKKDIELINDVSINNT